MPSARSFPAAASLPESLLSSTVAPDRIAALMQEWLDALTRAVHEAQKVGHLQTSIDAKQLGFEIHALGMGAIWASQLLDDKKAFAKVRTILCERLQQVQTKNAPRL